jgi:antitoxin VapB
MNAHSSRTFKSGNSEAVRLPKGLGFGIGTQVRIEREGNRLVLTAVEDPEAVRRDMESLIAELRRIAGPNGLPREERDVDWWPERPGL